MQKPASAVNCQNSDRLLLALFSSNPGKSPRLFEAAIPAVHRHSNSATDWQLGSAKTY